MGWPDVFSLAMKAGLLRTFFFPAMALALWPDCAQADLLNTNGADTAPNFAEVTILDDRVRVRLEIDFPDYPAFVPGGAAAIPAGTEPQPASLAKATGSTFRVLDADGTAIEPEIRDIEIRDRTQLLAARTAARPRNSPAPPARGTRVIAAQLDYPFSGRPDTLTLAPPLNGKEQASVNLGFIAYHGKVPVTDYRYLSRSETMRLDWDDPWYTVFANPNLTRHHKSAIMSFLTIAPREVRHEIIFRLRDLGVWTELDLGVSTTLDRAQVEAVIITAERHFATLPPLLIDGKAVKPSSVTALFLEAGAAGVTPVENPRAIDRGSALLGVILAYPHRKLPQSVEMTWELFTDTAQKVPVSVTDPAGPVPDWATPDSPKIGWKNFLKTWTDPQVALVKIGTGRALVLPVLSIALLAFALALIIKAFRSASGRWRWAAAVGVVVVAAVTLSAFTVSVPLPGPPDQKAATDISRAILTNTATAMLETGDAAFAEALDTFVPSEEAEAVGAEMRRGLSVTLPTGAHAITDSIEEVKIEKIEPRANGIDVLVRWTANMSGGHWGHQHRRRVSYRGLLDLEETDGVWKLRGLTVLSADLKP